MQILTEVEENMIEEITADDRDPEIGEDRDLEIADAQDLKIVDVQDQGIANAQDLEKVKNVLDQDLENHLGKNLKKIMIPKKVLPKIGKIKKWFALKIYDLFSILTYLFGKALDQI